MRATRLLLIFGIALLGVLVRQGSAQDAPPELGRDILLLRSLEADDRADASQRIQARGADSIPHLLEAMQGRFPGLQGIVSEKIVRLDDKDYASREKATQELVTLGRPVLTYLAPEESASVEKKERLKQIQIDVHYNQSIESERDDYFLIEALRIIKQMNATQAADAVVEVLSRENSVPVVKQAADTAGALHAVGAIQPLIMLLRHEVWSIREMAAFGLGQIGRPDSVGALKSVVNRDTHMEVRKRALWSLSRILDAAAAQILIESLSDPAWEIRSMADYYLRGVTENDFGFNYLVAPPPEGKKQEAIDRWIDWWKEKYGKDWSAD